MPIITVSRGSMSGGKALAECVASAFGAPCIGREILVEAAAQVGVSEDVLREKLELTPGLWNRVTAERRMYVVAVQAALAEHATSANLVYHGYVGHMLLRTLPAVLRVRLIAPLEMRIAMVMEQRGLTRDAAEQYIRQVDDGRLRWVRAMYDVDPRDPELYDLVLSLERMSIPSACAVVVAAANRAEFAVGDEMRAKLADFALTCRVRVAFATHPATKSLDLAIEAREGVVRISGRVPDPTWVTHTSTRWEHELRQVVDTVVGVKDVVLKIEPFDAYH